MTLLKPRPPFPFPVHHSRDSLAGYSTHPKQGLDSCHVMTLFITTLLALYNKTDSVGVELGTVASEWCGLNETVKEESLIELRMEIINLNYPIRTTRM